MNFEMQCPNCGHAWFLPSTSYDDILNAPERLESVRKPADAGPRDEPDDEPAEFEPLSEEPLLFRTSGPVLPAMLELSDRQLRDVLKEASSTSNSAYYLASLMFLSLAFQGFVIFISVLAVLGSSGRVDISRFAAFVALVAGALVTLVSALLLGNYGTSLKAFVRSRESESLVQSLRSGSRFWLWTAVVMTFTAVLSALAMFATLAENH
ncbi:MAG: hypothetical protein DCC68_13420 [Planctomycetota bacterium]|nr:MAG: hypothetical protein DCC68_13420 [Planctomycetota bacterium]